MPLYGKCTACVGAVLVMVLTYSFIEVIFKLGMIFTLQI